MLMIYTKKIGDTIAKILKDYNLEYNIYSNIEEYVLELTELSGSKYLTIFLDESEDEVEVLLSTSGMVDEPHVLYASTSSIAAKISETLKDMPNVSVITPASKFDDSFVRETVIASVLDDRDYYEESKDELKEYTGGIVRTNKKKPIKTIDSIQNEEDVLSYLQTTLLSSTKQEEITQKVKQDIKSNSKVEIRTSQTEEIEELLKKIEELPKSNKIDSIQKILEVKLKSDEASILISAIKNLAEEEVESMNQKFKAVDTQLEVIKENYNVSTDAEIKSLISESNRLEADFQSSYKDIRENIDIYASSITRAKELLHGATKIKEISGSVPKELVPLANSTRHVSMLALNEYKEMTELVSNIPQMLQKNSETLARKHNEVKKIDNLIIAKMGNQIDSLKNNANIVFQAKSDLDSKMTVVLGGERVGKTFAALALAAKYEKKSQVCLVIDLDTSTPSLSDYFKEKLVTPLDFSRNIGQYNSSKFIGFSNETLSDMLFEDVEPIQLVTDLMHELKNNHEYWDAVVIILRQGTQGFEKKVLDEASRVFLATGTDSSKYIELNEMYTMLKRDHSHIQLMPVVFGNVNSALVSEIPLLLKMTGLGANTRYAYIPNYSVDLFKIDGLGNSLSRIYSVSDKFEADKFIGLK